MESDVLEKYEALKKAVKVFEDAVHDLEPKGNIEWYNIEIIKGVISSMDACIDSMAGEINAITDQPPQRPGTGGD